MSYELINHMLKTRSKGIAAGRRSPAGGRPTAILHHSNRVPNTPQQTRGEKARPGEQSSGGREASGAAALQLSPYHQLCCDTRIVC